MTGFFLDMKLFIHEYIHSLLIPILILYCIT